MSDLDWRADIDALVFTVPGGCRCFMHRLAFRSLIGRSAQPADCLRFFRENSTAFIEAAERRRNTLPAERQAAFHLTSRHVRR